jgi:hypothetical protein
MMTEVSRDPFAQSATTCRIPPKSTYCRPLKIVGNRAQHSDTQQEGESHVQALHLLHRSSIQWAGTTVMTRPGMRPRGDVLPGVEYI